MNPWIQRLAQVGELLKAITQTVSQVVLILFWLLGAGLFLYGLWPLLRFFIA